MNAVQSIAQFFTNLVLNAIGVERTFLEHIDAGDISKALAMMTSNEKEVKQAINEYNPETHAVMYRTDKSRSGRDPYNVCKLPRSRQAYINEIELFFLLGSPIVWNKRDGDDEAFQLFTDFLKAKRYNSKMRTAKRLAGAETESAKFYRLYKDEKGKPRCDVVILARSLGYEIRTLIDQYGKLLAVAYGYTTKASETTSIQHWDFLTPNATYETTKGSLGYDVKKYVNPTGRINLIYYKQPKSWDGVQRRIEREEEMDSKIGDTNNYFADPIAEATADVVKNLADPSTPGKLIILNGEKSSFRYIEPPQASELRRDEKEDNAEAILFDSFTPDFSFDKLVGMGTLSGVAVKRAMLLGYIKRANRMETYEEMVDREVSVIKGVLAYLYPEMRSKIEALEVDFEFGEPFNDDTASKWRDIADLYGSGLLSLEEAVDRLGIVDSPDEEVARIRDEAQRSKERQIEGFRPTAK